MKKIILIFMCFLLTGCYDYKELNDMEFIVGMAITHQDDYEITYEVVMPSKENSSSYFVTGTGKTLESAMEDANRFLFHDPFFDHLKIVLLGTNIHPLQLSDYFMRSHLIDSHFHLLYAEDPVSEITMQEDNQIASVSLYQKVSDSTLFFDQVMSLLLEGLSATYIPVVEKHSLLENCYLVGSSAMRLASTEESILVELLSGKSLLLSEEDLSIRVTGSYKQLLSKNEIVFSLQGILEKGDSKEDYRTVEAFRHVEESFSPRIQSYIAEALSSLQKDSFDLFGWNVLHYQLTNSFDSSFFSRSDIAIGLVLKVDKNGLIGAGVTDEY